jgi:hypothetical protein
LNFKGLLLTYLTLGTYGFWWMRDRFSFYVDNLSWEVGEGSDVRVMRFRGTATGGGFFGLILTNLLIVIFTLGIGYAWAEVRLLRYVLANIEMVGDADLNAVVHSERMAIQLKMHGSYRGQCLHSPFVTVTPATGAGTVSVSSATTTETHVLFSLYIYLFHDALHQFIGNICCFRYYEDDCIH